MGSARDKFYYFPIIYELDSADMVPGQAEITQLMIMLNIFDGTSRPSDIARNIDITLQGVQYHLKILKSKGYVNDDNTLSQNGFEYLYSGLNNMRSFVSENIFRLDRVITWEAISRDDIRTGDPVYLKMENGYLSAFKDEVSKSKGISVNDSEKGGIVGVTRVEGIIGLEVRGITIIILPDVEFLNGMDEVAKKIRSTVNLVENDLIAVVGEEARVVSLSMGIENPIEYAPLEASFEAASRGLSTVMLVSNRRFRFMVDELKNLENKNEGISVKIFTV